jgi:hypothetical protein
MRKLGILVLALALGACDSDNDGNPAGPSSTGPVIFSVQLSAANEVPPITNAESGGRGTATITFDVPRDSSGNPTGGGTATFNLQLTGFPPGSVAVAAHIHPGAAGVNGGVLVPVTGLSQAAPIVMATGAATLTLTGSNVSQAQATQIMANPEGFYFNVHTPTNPSGAVRGQLTRFQ